MLGGEWRAGSRQQAADSSEYSVTEHWVSQEIEEIDPGDCEITHPPTSNQTTELLASFLVSLRPCILTNSITNVRTDLTNVRACCVLTKYLLSTRHLRHPLERDSAGLLEQVVAVPGAARVRVRVRVRVGVRVRVRARVRVRVKVRVRVRVRVSGQGQG